MLGIRHCQGVAIDLWQGDVELFVNDLTIRMQTLGADQINAKLVELLQSSEQKIARHLAIDVGTNMVEFATQLMSELHKLLSEQPRKSLRRLTFVLPDLNSYYVFQDALFRYFPE